MFCRKCGKELPDNLNFCTGCGAKVIKLTDSPKEIDKVWNESDVPQFRSNNHDYEIKNETIKNQELYPENSKNSVAMKILMIVAVIFLFVVGFFIMRGIGFNSSSNNGTPQSGTAGAGSNVTPSSSASSATQSSSVAPKPSSATPAQQSSSATADTSGPKEVISGYVKGLEYALNSKSIEPISKYLKTDSSIYKSQSSYVKKDFTLKLDTFEIMDIQMQDENNCVVSTRESYYVQKPGQQREHLTQECKYKLEKTSGKWVMTDFADTVKVISRTNG